MNNDAIVSTDPVPPRLLEHTLTATVSIARGHADTAVNGSRVDGAVARQLKEGYDGMHSVSRHFRVRAVVWHQE